MLHIIGYTISYLIGALIGAALANLIIERQETKKIQKEVEQTNKAMADYLQHCLEKMQENKKTA